MELFIRSTYRKSEAAVVVQNLLEHQAKAGMFSLDPASLANKLVAAVWDQKPDIYNGKFGQRPHKLTVAASALANGIHLFHRDDLNRKAMILSLINIMSELDVNNGLYPLNSLDQRLLMGLRSFCSELYDINTLRKASTRRYDTFEEWYNVFKKTAGDVNPQLKVDQDNKSLLDFMEHEPLKRAFQDAVEPEPLARDFAKQFDVFTFGRS